MKYLKLFETHLNKELTKEIKADIADIFLEVKDAGFNVSVLNKTGWFMDKPQKRCICIEIDRRLNSVVYFYIDDSILEEAILRLKEYCKEFVIVTEVDESDEFFNIEDAFDEYGNGEEIFKLEIIVHEK